MERIYLLILVATLGTSSILAQQELLDTPWILDYMVIGTDTIDVPEPSGINPPCDDPFFMPGIHFWEETGGYQVSANITLNYYFNVNGPIEITETTISVPEGVVSLGDCDCLCNEEIYYLQTILMGELVGQRQFDYEIIEQANNGHTLIITSPEGYRAVHNDFILSILDSGSERGPFVYPNPAADRIHFDWPHSGTQPVKLILYDISGRVVASQPYESSFDISTLSNGRYFVKVESVHKKLTVLSFLKQ